MQAAPKVQRGAVTITSADGLTKTVTLSPAVTKSRALLKFTARSADTSGGRELRHQFRGLIASDGASFVLTRTANSSATNVTVEWEVIEFAAGDATVQQ